jgi:hypothetical protein
LPRLTEEFCHEDTKKQKSLTTKHTKGHEDFFGTDFLATEDTEVTEIKRVPENQVIR